MKYGTAGDATEAAVWLCQRMGFEPASLGWRGHKAHLRRRRASAVGRSALKPDAEDWAAPVPLPEGLLPVAPFDYDLLPEKLRGRVEDVTERMQCPSDFVAPAP